MKSIVDYLKGIARTTIIRSAYLWTALAKRPSNQKKQKRVLIVKIDAIGDFIIFSPMLKYYRELFKDYEITLLINEVNTVFAQRFQEQKLFDHVITFNRKKISRSFQYTKTFFALIRNKNFDIAVYPIYSRELLGDYIMATTGAEKRIGFDGNYKNISLSWRAKTDHFYTDLLLAASTILPEPERNKEFAEGLACKFGKKIKIDDYLPTFIPNDSDQKAAAEVLSQAGFDPAKKYLIVCPGSSDPFRNWPIENFAEVMRVLHEELGIEMIIGGSQREASLAQALQSLLNFSVIDITGKTSLPVFAAVCTKSLLYFGNDTGTTHIAAATGLPIVSIMGGGIDRFFPYGDPATHIAIYDEAAYALTGPTTDARFQIMHGTERNVTVKQALDALRMILK